MRIEIAAVGHLGEHARARLRLTDVGRAFVLIVAVTVEVAAAFELFVDAGAGRVAGVGGAWIAVVAVCSASAQSDLRFGRQQDGITRRRAGVAAAFRTGPAIRTILAGSTGELSFSELGAARGRDRREHDERHAGSRAEHVRVDVLQRACPRYLPRRPSRYFVGHW